MIESLTEVLQLVISWPSVAIIALLVFRTPIKKIVERLINSDSGKAKVGPIEIELGKIAEQGQKAVNDLNRINYIMAESRRLELEITLGMAKNMNRLECRLLHMIKMMKCDNIYQNCASLQKIPTNNKASSKATGLN